MSKRLPDVTENSSVSTTDQVVVITSSDQVRLASVQVLPTTPVVTTGISDSKNWASDRTNHRGVDIPRIVSITANYSLILADLISPTIIRSDATSPITVIFPSNASVSALTGTSIEIIQMGTGAVTVAGAAGVSVLSAGSPTTRARYSSIHILKVASDTILVSQELLASGGPVLVTNPSIAGTGISGGVLTLTPGTYSPDGTHTRQWRRVNLTTGAITNIGAGATTYTTVAGDEGFGVDCVETVTDANGLSTQGISNRINVVAAASKPVNTVPPFIVAGSSNVVGGTVTVNAGSWSNTPTGYKFQRRLNGVNSGGVTDQAGATLAYVIQTGEESQTISWSVVAYNGSGDAVVAVVSPNWLVSGVAPIFTTNPVITYASAVVGNTLTCSDGVINTTATLTRRWKFFDPAGPWSGYIQPPQTGATYDSISADIGSQISCEVTATNAYGTAVATALGPTILIDNPLPPPPPPPPVSTRGPRISSFTPSGDITAVTGQIISGKSFSGTGNKITIPYGVTGVLIEDCTFTTTGVGGIGVVLQGSNCTIRYCNFGTGERGIYCGYASNSTIALNTFINCGSGDPNVGHALTNNFSPGGIVIDNNAFMNSVASPSPADVISNFASDRVTIINNYFDVDIDHTSGAPFTVGDTDRTTGGSPGGNHYIAFNEVHHTGSTAPPGIFGSEGNSIIEYNCFPTGMTIMYYPPENPSPLVGVTIRHNIINMAASVLSAVNVVPAADWATNIDGTNCALTPRP